MAQLTINYTATADLTTLSNSWLSTNVASSTYDNTTQEGTLTLNDGVTEITFRALQSISQLLSIEFPEGFLTIADSAFYLCNNLTSIHIPASVTLIKGQICTGSVRSVTVASGNTVYNDANGSNVIIETATNKLISASANCVLPEGITTIGGSALAGLSLGYKELPSTLTTLENYAMNNNNGVIAYYFKNPHPISLTHDQIELVFGNILVPQIIVPTAEAKAEYEADEVWSNKVGQFVVYDGNARITYESSSDLSNFSSFITDNKLSSTYDSNSGIGTIDFPGGFYIPTNAFYHCNTLTSIDISKFSSIGNNAFYRCSNLATINIDSTFIVFCGETFANTAWRNSLPDGIIYKDNICFGYKGAKPSGDLIIPDYIKCIADTAFQNCTDITSITFGENLLYIRDQAFQGVSINTLTTNTKLKFFKNSNNFRISTINWNVKTIGAYQAVSLGSSALTTLNLGNQVFALSEFLFKDSTNLTSVTLPDSLEITSRESFANCSSLTSINLPQNLRGLGFACFDRCTNLTTVYYNSQYTINYYLPPYTTTLIYGGAATQTGSGFKGNTNLVSIDFGPVTSISYEAFSGCTSLASVTIPDSITGIANGAFRGCTSLASVMIGDDITSIDQYTFQNCTSLASVTFPDSITSIAYGAFQNCTSLTSITLPSSITRVSNYAFNGCTNLLSVICLATTPPALESNNFTISDDTLYVPSIAKSSYQNNSSWRSAFTTIAGIYNLTTSVSGSGSIIPSEGPLYEGDDVTLTITPDEGYGIFSVTDNGTSVPVTHTGMTYTISSIAADHAIAVVFKPLFTITTSAGEGGSITPTMTVMQNEDATIVITPSVGYSVSHVYVDGTDQGSILNYSFQNVVANHTVTAEFVQLYTVSTTITGSGTITPESSTVVAGSDVTLTITPDEGMLIFNVLDNDVPVPVLNPLGMTYTISNIQENHTVEAIFMVAQKWGFDLSEMIDTDFIIQTLEELEERK